MASASVAVPPPLHSTQLYYRSDAMQDIQSGDNSRSPERRASFARSPPKMVIIKKEHSPDPSPRHRPKALNLTNTGSNHQSAQTPRTAMTMREVGMACLSPGLNVTDTAMREQLERSMGVRDQQRLIIENRLQRNAHGSKDDQSEMHSGTFTPLKGRRKPPPGGLSIVAPHHSQFANERIIQSAPLNQSFTVNRQRLLEARERSNANRLPPIADVVFGPERTERDSERERPQLSSSLRQPEQRSFFPPPPVNNNSRTEYPTPMQLDKPERPREYKSAEEAVASMTGGREDLLPRIVHYGGHQPPTPPSPTSAAMAQSAKRVSSLGQSSLKTKTTTLTIPAQAHEVTGTKRRRRNDFERDDSTGSENEAEAAEAKRRKKEQFLSLCAQAWDLLHS